MTNAEQSALDKMQMPAHTLGSSCLSCGLLSPDLIFLVLAESGVERQRSQGRARLTSRARSRM